MTAYRIMFSRPDHVIDGTIGTGTHSECAAAAPAIARTVKREAGLRWVAWKVVNA